MTGRVLQNKPLVEAIFELHWQLDSDGNTESDPHYKILPGRLHAKIEDQYPIHEPLQTAAIPDEMIPYLPQHRFRAGKGEWPLIQLGPGVITLNDTQGYVWANNFQNRINDMVSNLYKAYPKPQELKLKSIILRYIDAIEFDYSNEDILQFLHKKMNIQFGFNDKLFSSTDFDRLPLTFDARFSFRCSNPPGQIGLRFFRGQVNSKDSLIWETVFQSEGLDVPQNQDAVIRWAAQAHELSSDWFFKTIDGELLERFS